MNGGYFDKKYYGADPEEEKKVTSAKNKQFLGLFFGVILICAFFLLLNAESEAFKKSEREMYSLLKYGALFGAIIELVTSPIEITNLSRKEDMLSRTFLSLEENCVKGVSFGSASYSSDVVTFEINYGDIYDAEVLPETPSYKGNNIEIHSQEGNFTCYAIEDKFNVVRLINERKVLYCEYLSQSSRQMYGYDVQPSRTEIPTAENKFCTYCGKALMQDAVFCCECGKKQNM